MDITSEFKCDDSMVEFSKNLKSELFRLKSSSKDHEQIIEDRNQEVYVLKRQIELLKTQELEYQQEIENITFSELTRFKSLQERIQELETSLNRGTLESNCEIEHLQSECKLLKKTVAKFEENQSIVVPSVGKGEYDALLEENEVLKSRYDFTSDRYSSAMNEVNQYQIQLQKLNVEMEDTRITYASNSTEMKAKLEEQEEQIAMLRVELSTSQVVQQNKEEESHESRGNSMFSEVYDNWVRLKQKNDNLAVVYKEARHERNKLRNEAATLRKENALMCAQWKAEGIEARQKDVDLINTYKYANEKLQRLIKKYEEDLTKERSINYSSPDTHISVYMNMIKSKNEQIDKLYKEFRQANGSTIIHRMEIREVNNKARRYLTEATQFKNEVEQLQEQLNALKRNETNTTHEDKNDGSYDIDASASASADNYSKSIAGVTDISTESKCSCQHRKSMRDVAIMTERILPISQAFAQPFSRILRTEKQCTLDHTSTLTETNSEVVDSNLCTEQRNDDCTKENDSTKSNIMSVPKTAQGKKVQFADSVLASPFVNQQRRKPRPRGKPVDCTQMIVIKRQSPKKL